MFQSNYRATVDLLNRVKKKLADMSGAVLPADQRKWIELTKLDLMRRMFVSGATNVYLPEIVKDLQAYVMETDFDKKYDMREKLDRKLMRYPVRTKRMEVKRTVQNINEVAPAAVRHLEEGVYRGFNDKYVQSKVHSLALDMQDPEISENNRRYLKSLGLTYRNAEVQLRLYAKRHKIKSKKFYQLRETLRKRWRE
jgi:hypothetical protein